MQKPARPLHLEGCARCSQSATHAIRRNPETKRWEPVPGTKWCLHHAEMQAGFRDRNPSAIKNHVAEGTR